MSKEWQPKPKKKVGERTIKRNRKINHTSEQNALVDAFSPDVIIEDTHYRNCDDCSRKIYY